MRVSRLTILTLLLAFGFVFDAQAKPTHIVTGTYSGQLFGWDSSSPYYQPYDVTMKYIIDTSIVGEDQTPTILDDDRNVYRQAIVNYGVELRYGFYDVSGSLVFQTLNASSDYQDTGDIYVTEGDSDLMNFTSTGDFPTSSNTIQLLNRSGEYEIAFMQSTFQELGIYDGNGPDSVLIEPGEAIPNAELLTAIENAANFTSPAYKQVVLDKVGDHDLVRLDSNGFDTLTITEIIDADLAAPYGQLDSADVNAFIEAFQNGDMDVDFAAPFGQLSLSDVTAFLTSFAAGY